MVNTLNEHPDALTIQLGNRNKEIMAELHILDIRLVQLKFVPPEHHPENEIQLRPRKIHTQARPRPATKANQIPLQRQTIGRSRIIEPALGDVFVAIWENRFVVRDFRDGHADVGIGRDSPVFVLQWHGPSGPGVARTESVAEARGFHDASSQIRHLLQRVQLQRGAIWEGGDEVGVQAIIDARRIDNVEGGDAEGEGGGFYAAADDDLGFFCEAFLRFVFWREFGLEDFLEDGLFGVVGLDGFAGHGSTDV